MWGETDHGEKPVNASAKVAVLGLVLERPSYGYELAQRFERVFGGQAWEWVVSPAAIYKALNELEDEELIEEFDPAPDAATSRQPKKHYRATAKGARMMRAWLETPLPTDPSRAELLIRLNSGSALNPTGLAEVLSAHAATCLDELREIARAPSGSVFQRLVREQRRLTVQAQLSWIDYALAELRGMHDAEETRSRS
jgi:DNA-binding PadR family transcriptional regulator